MSKKIQIQMYFKTGDGETYKKTLSYVNPNVSDERLGNFIKALKKLSADRLTEVYKVISQFLNEVDPEPVPDVPITADDIAEIISGEYIEVEDDDGITRIEINSILDGSFEPVEDEDGITAEDIAKIMEG